MGRCTAQQDVTRKLAAILAADVVGCSWLMEADEDATIRTLDTYRQVVDGLVENPRVSIELAIRDTRTYYKNQDDRDHWFEGYRKAGLDV